MECHSIGAGCGCDAGISQNAFGDDNDFSFLQCLPGFKSRPETRATSANNEDVTLDSFHNIFRAYPTGVRIQKFKFQSSNVKGMTND